MNIKKKISFCFISIFSVLFSMSLPCRNLNEATAEEPIATCLGVANDENNNILETVAQQNPVPRYRTLLKYDVSFSDTANTVNVVQETGQGIKLNGVKLSDIPNTLVDYANGTKYIRIKIPQTYLDNLGDETTLEVIAGTRFENYYLDNALFKLENNKWKSVKKVDFVKIQWNDIGYDFYDKKNGVLLNFSAFLSNKSTEYNAGIQSTNFADTVGEHIYLGGIKLSTLPGAFVSYHSQGLLFIYADNMTAYRTLKIDDGTIFLDAALPEVYLTYSVSTKWSTNEKTYSDVTFNRIEWNNFGYDYYADKKGILIKFNEYLSNVANEYSSKVQTANLAKSVGDHIYLGGYKLSLLPGAMVSYHSTCFLFIYADGMTAYRTLKIEKDTKVLDSSLPELNFTFSVASNWSLGGEVTYNDATYSNIRWNDIGYDFYDKKNGILIEFEENLSNVANEYGGGIRSTNFANSVGEHIYLGGIKLSTLPGAMVSYHSTIFLFIYAENMASYRTLSIEAGTHFIDSTLPELNFYYDVSSKWSTQPKTYANVSYTGLTWNNIGYEFYKDMNGVLINYNAYLSNLSFENNGGIRSFNFASSLGEHIYLDDVKISTLPGAFVSYHSTSLLFIYAPTMTNYSSLKIESTNFLDITLPELELFFDGTKWVTEIIPMEDRAICLGIANDVNNNILEPVDKTGASVPRYRTLLRYDVDLGTVANTVNVVSSTGEGILLNGVKLSQIQYALIDYAHGTKFLEIKIPQEYQDSLTGEIILEVIEGTHFESKILNYSKFVLRNGQWAEYVKPTQVEFKSILWNNTGKDVYDGKNGVLLSYSGYLSNVSKETKGSLNNTNLVNDEVGTKILLDKKPLRDIKDAEVMYFGSSFLWIYVPNMDSYKELDIESCTFITTILPETHFSFNGNKWVESFKINININGVNKVEYYKKDEQVVLNQQYFSKLLDDKNVSPKLVYFKVGNKYYGQDESLTINKNTDVTALVIGFETTNGAAIKMTNPVDMRFESKINRADFDYLNLTFGDTNIERGTFIVPKNSFGLDSVSKYLNDSNKSDGVDYVKKINTNFANQSSAQSDEMYKYYGVYQGIMPGNYSTEYYGVGYIKVVDGLNEFITFSGSEIDNCSRSVYEVAKRSYGDYELNSAPLNALNEYLDGVVSLVSGKEGLEIENLVDGYNSPYTLSFNKDTNEYVITGVSSIDTVLFNGTKMTNNKKIVVNVNDNAYKVTNYNLDNSGDSSMLKFKLEKTENASTLVDFTVQIPSNREMRILQITDTQIIDSSQKRSPGRLGDVATEMWNRGTMDKNCFNHIKELVDKENPDLIIFTGDIVYGEFDDTGEILTEIINFMESLGIPWAPVFGNHDNESNKGVNWQCKQFENATNCLFKQANLTGNGNYSIGLIDENGKINRVIYMLDSNGCINAAGFGQDQIDWIGSVSSSIKSAYGENVPGFACFHIPTIDFRNAYVNKYHFAIDDNFSLDDVAIDGDYGNKNENMSLIGTSLAEVFKNANIDGVFAGHDHVNNFSILYDGIRYTYGTKTGVYDYYNPNYIGGTLIKLNKDGLFKVSSTYLDEKDIAAKPALTTKITVTSDIHHDLNDYGGFYCTKSLAKLRKILDNTKDSNFYINLGDTVNSLNGNLLSYYDVMSVYEEYGISAYNSIDNSYLESEKVVYNLLGNHEVAYNYKTDFVNYVPYKEGIGSCGVFKRDGLLFVAVDALFDRSGSDEPENILPCTEFTIPDKEYNWLKEEVKANMDESVTGIVWISHVALQDIDATSKNKLLGELKTYRKPMTVFEGHTHIENYQELKDSQTGEVYCQVYTLPAVILYDNYPYYDVIFKNGRVWWIDKHNGVLK